MTELRRLESHAAAGRSEGRLLASEGAVRSGREPLLSAARIADALGVSRRWVYAQVEEHQMPVYRPAGGRALLFELSAVEAWLDAYRTGDWSAGSCADPGPAVGILGEMQELQGG